MDTFPRLPSTARRPVQFSTRALFLLTAVTAVVISLYKSGGLLIVAGVLAMMMTLTVMAVFVSQLRPAISATLCIFSLMFSLLAAIAVSERSNDIRARLAGILGESYGDRNSVDLAMLWICIVGISIVLGTFLGWAISVANGRD
jgi:hypothetical protein